MFSSGDFINSPEQEERHRDGQVDRHVFTAPEALKRCMDGHATGIRHEPRAKTKPVSRCPESVE